VKIDITEMVWYMDKNRIKELEALSFEKSLELLESTVTKMESGQ
jgi:exonuclease VII small subunit